MAATKTSEELVAAMAELRVRLALAVEASQVMRRRSAELRAAARENRRTSARPGGSVAR